MNVTTNENVSKHDAMGDVNYTLPSAGMWTINFSCHFKRKSSDADWSSYNGLWVWGLEFAQPYTITCIDIDTYGNRELGREERSSDMVPPYTPFTASINDFGNDTTPNKYYTGYKFKEGSPDQTVTKGANIILYRYFEPIRYTVNIHPNQPEDATHIIEVDNKINTESYTKESEETYSKEFVYDYTPVAPPQDYFELVGWHLEKDKWYNEDETKQYPAGSKTLTTEDNDTVDLYPKWIKNKYTINYSGNNTTKNIYGDTVSTSFTGTTANTPCEYDTNVTLATNTFNKVGYKFKEWNTKSDGSGTSFENGETLTKPNFTAVDGGTYTLYAIWEPIRYSIVFHSNDTFADYNAIDKYNYTYTYNGEQHTDIRFDQPIQFKPNTFTRRDNVTSISGELIEKGYTWFGYGLNNPEKTIKDYDDTWSGTNFENCTTDNTTFNLYSLWSKELQLTFDLNDGYLDGSPDSIQLKSKVYNKTYKYTFGLYKNPTPASIPQYTAQNQEFDAYGNYDDNGINTHYTKSTDEGVQYRFLGWSVNSNAEIPDTNLDVYSASRNIQLTVYNNGSFYAVWEPTLLASIELKRSLGDKGSSDNTFADNLSAVSTPPTLKITATSGEQCNYKAITRGRTDITLDVDFDTKITDIYNNGDKSSTWYDNLNPVTSENLNELQTARQKHGLNRHIQNAYGATQRKFYIPQYLGTDRSYTSSIGVNEYNIRFIFTQQSYYWTKYKGVPETITVNTLINLITPSAIPGVTPTPTPTPPGGDPDPTPTPGELPGKLPSEENGTTVVEFNTRIIA